MQQNATHSRLAERPAARREREREGRGDNNDILVAAPQQLRSGNILFMLVKKEKKGSMLSLGNICVSRNIFAVGFFLLPPSDLFSKPDHMKH